MGTSPYKICLKKQIDVAKFTSDVITEQLSKNKNSVLGLATGSTPEQTYHELVKRHISHKKNWSQVRTINLDEYFGLEKNNPQSYAYYMHFHLFKHVGIPECNTFLPDGTTSDPISEGQAYEQRIIDLGGIDLWLIGIGSNGHIAFNEPGSSRNSRTRLVNLSEQTIIDNSRLFEKKTTVPTQAITVGIATIMEAKRVILIATGKKKSKAICAALNGPIGPECPASFLRKHPNCTFVVDEAAATLCRNSFV